MVALDEAVRMVILQFSFSNPEAIPASVRHLTPETWRKHMERKSHSNGVLVISPTPNCSLESFPRDVEESGYEMVDAFYEERIDSKDPHGQRRYHMVRFTFARREFAEASEEFKERRDLYRLDLFEEICRKALWRVRAFDNPFFQNGEAVPGQRALVVNLEGRTPFFRADGSVVTVWQKDAEGHRVGDAPLPLRPNLHLSVLDRTVRLVPVP